MSSWAGRFAVMKIDQIRSILSRAEMLDSGRRNAVHIAAIQSLQCEYGVDEKL